MNLSDESVKVFETNTILLKREIDNIVETITHIDEYEIEDTIINSIRDESRKVLERSAVLYSHIQEFTTNLVRQKAETKSEELLRKEV